MYNLGSNMYNMYNFCYNGKKPRTDVVLDKKHTHYWNEKLEWGEIEFKISSNKLDSSFRTHQLNWNHSDYIPFF